MEAALRLTGTKPGWIKRFDGFKKVDSLVLYKNFTTDEAGIYKFSPWVTDSLLKYFDCEKREIVNPAVKNALSESDKIYYLYESFCKQTVKPRFSLYWTLLERINQEVDSNCLVNAHQRIAQNKMSADSGWQAAFAEYFDRPFNRDGFRSIPFKNYSTRQLKVLVIGDSFVYGMEAHPFQNSFVDQLLTRGYLVYAAGIPGTDPAQYAAIAKKYIPLVKPDVVVCCFFTGNDLMSHEREPDAAKPHEHITNAGLFASEPYGEYLSPQEAYQFYLSLSTFPDSSERLFDKICSYTSIGSLLWNTLYNKNLVRHKSKDFYNREGDIPKDSIYARTKIYTDRMAAICTENKVPLIQTVIPDLNPLPLDTAVLGYLFNHNYHLPMNLKDDVDYFKGGIHFNTEGSFKFANFIDTLLQPYSRAKALSFTPEL